MLAFDLPERSHPVHDWKSWSASACHQTKVSLADTKLKLIVCVNSSSLSKSALKLQISSSPFHKQRLLFQWFLFTVSPKLTSTTLSIPEIQRVPNNTNIPKCPQNLLSCQSVSLNIPSHLTLFPSNSSKHSHQPCSPTALRSTPFFLH